MKKSNNCIEENVDKNTEKQEVVLEEDGLKEETKDKKDNVEKINSYLGIAGTVISILSVFGPALFFVIEYMYNWGKCAFWNIPIDYMQLKVSGLILYIMLIISVIIVLCAISYLIYNYVVVGSKRKMGKMIRRVLLVFITVFFMFIVYFVLGVCAVPPYYSICDLGKQEWLYIVKWGLKLSLYITPYALLIGVAIHSTEVMECIVGVFKKIKFSKKNKKENKKCDNIQLLKPKEDINKVEKKRTDSDVYRSLGILLIIFPIFMLALLLYNEGYNSQANSTSVEIVSVNDKEYVIVGIYDGKWILKECMLDENILKIQKSSYSFLEISNYSITHYNLNKGISACMVDEL